MDRIIHVRNSALIFCGNDPFPYASFRFFYVYTQVINKARKVM